MSPFYRFLKSPSPVFISFETPFAILPDAIRRPCMLRILKTMPSAFFQAVWYPGSQPAEIHPISLPGSSQHLLQGSSHSQDSGSLCTVTRCGYYNPASHAHFPVHTRTVLSYNPQWFWALAPGFSSRSEEHTSELQSQR